jgi:hydrogenase maturation protein HypF
VERAAGEPNIGCIALGGGCFHNDILLRVLSDRLTRQGLQVLIAQQMQPNDSAISLGQAWIALKIFKREN